MTQHTAISEPEVVIIEDEQSLADLFAQTLEDQYTVKVAYSGEEGIEQIDHTTDLVLLDRRMPNMNGKTVLRKVRQAGYDCRVVMVTAVDPGFDIVDMEFEGYLVKPVSQEELTATVNEQLMYAVYDQKIKQYTRVRSKINVLQESKSSIALEEDERFEQLRAKADAIKEEIERLLADHSEAVTPHQ